MSKAVNSKWKKTFPDTIGNQNRPATGVDDTQPFETGAFPQYMANDPVRYDLQNAAMSQSMSNDARLKEMVNARGKELDDHKVDPGAHKTGIAGNAATATKVVTTAAAGVSANIAEATMASSDSARIRVSGAENAGELALETANDGDEAIVARQYTGVYTNAVRTAKILDESGNTSFPGTVVAPKFTGTLNGNASTATKLATPRTLSLSGKAAGSTTFDGSANADINVTSVNADTASKLSTARKINITGNASGSANFDGTSDINISTTVNESKHAVKADTAANANKLASESGSNYLFINTEEDNWSVIGPNPGDWLKSIRTDVSAPPYSIGNYSTAIAFGGRDTKGIITHAYDSPDVKFAGGSGSTAGWKFTIHGGANNEFYDLNNFPTKTGNGASGTWGINISGNAASATTANTATNASHASNADSATKIVNNGNRDDIANGAKAPSGLSVYQCYVNTGYPQQYGNVVSIGGTGDNELFLGWVDDSRLLYRAKRDQDTNWTNWRAIAFTDEINNYAPTKTGVGASGTWGISITGNANTASTASSVPWTGVTGKPGTYPPSAHNHDSAYPSVTGTRASGTWGINISGNAASATNADTVDGYHASDLLRTLGGNRTPVITDIFDRAGTIDMSTMSAADKATHKANINKAPNMVQNLWNDACGIYAYGGDNDIAGEYNRGTLKLTQSYKNFDKLMIIFTDDKANWELVRMFDVYEFNYYMTSLHSFTLLENNLFWCVYGLTKQGTDASFKPSTETVLSCRYQNCGIIGIYGIKY